MSAAPLSDAQKLAEWLALGDTGLSSETLALRMCGIPNGRHGICYPHDGDDFGRCYRLLQRYPEWRARLSEVMTPASPYWAALVERWADIEAAYLADKKLYDETHSRDHSQYRCYDLLRSILYPIEDVERTDRAP